MFNKILNMLPQFQQIGLSLMLVIVCIAMLVLWNDVRRLHRTIRQVHAQTQKNLRELGQQRYALANLRQAMIKPDAAAAEQDLFQMALNQLDELLKNLPDTLAHGDDKNVEQLNEREILNFVRKALRGNQLAIAMQPIKTFPSAQTRFYEVFSRIQVGNQYVPAGKFLAIAKNNGLMDMIDQAFLLKTLDQIQKSADDDIMHGYFCNLSAATFANKQIMNTIINYLAAHPRLSTRMVFEMTQDDTFKLGNAAKATVSRLIELGCRFSMDNIKMIGLDVVRLRELQISFVKFNVDTIIKEMDSPKGTHRWDATRNLLESQGIDLIVEKIETAKQVEKLRDSGLSYAQGYYFGAPDIIAS